MFNNLFSSSRNPFLYLVLLLVITLLKLPIFNENYFAVEESEYIIAAKRIAEGGLVYQDVWHTKPPFTIWVYTLFELLFKDDSLFFIRIFSIAYLFIVAILFLKLVSDYQQSTNFPLFSATIFCIFLLTPWYNQDLNPDLLLLLPTLIIIQLFITNFFDEKKSWENLLWIGLLLAVAISIDLKGLLLSLSVIIGYVTQVRPTIREAIIIQFGFLFGILLIFLPIYYQDGINNFFDLVILFKFDHIRFGQFSNEQSIYNWKIEYVLMFVPQMMLFLYGYYKVKIKSRPNSIRQRKIEILIHTFLMCGLVGIILLGQHFYNNPIISIIPFTTFYVSISILEKYSWFSRLITSITSIVIPIIFYGFIIIINTNFHLRIYNIRNELPLTHLIEDIHKYYHPSIQLELIKSDITKHQIKSGIFITDSQPELYLKLKKKCASKYIVFGQAQYKMDWLSINQKRPQLISSPEDLAKIFKYFKQEKPEYIIDPNGIFEEIRYKIPLLLSDYQLKKLGNYKIYFLKNSM